MSRNILYLLLVIALVTSSLIYYWSATSTEPRGVTEELPPQASPPVWGCNTLPLIQLPISVTSRNLKKSIATFHELPLVQYALSSFVPSAEPARFRYAIAIAADRGDLWYDNSGHQREIRAWFLANWTRHWPDACPVALSFHVYANTRSRNTWAVNYATAYGYEMGADYFYRINDDTVLLGNNWSSVFVHELANMRPIPNLGVTGPWDPFLNGKLLTHSFISCLHLEWYGTHFPFLLGNYFTDDWIQYVYSPPYPATFGDDAHMMSIVKDVTVKHMTLQARYEIKSTREQYTRQLDIDRRELETYVVKKRVESNTTTRL